MRGVHRPLLLVLLGLAAVGQAAPAAKPVDANTVVSGRALFEAGKHAEAAPLLHAALAAIDAGKLSRGELGQCLWPLIEIERSAGRTKEALLLAERYHQHLLGLKGVPAPRLEHLTKNAVRLSELLEHLQRFADAEKRLNEAVTFIGQWRPVDPTIELGVRIKLARLAETTKQPDAAKKHWQAAEKQAVTAIQRIQRRELAMTLYAKCVQGLVACQLARQDQTAAVASLERLLAAQQQSKDNLGELKALVELSAVLRSMGRPADARRRIEEALDRHGAALAAYDEAELRINLAHLLADEGRLADAAPQWRRAIELYEQVAADPSKTPAVQKLVVLALERKQSALEHMRQFEAAIATAEQLVALHSERLGATHPQTYSARSGLGALYGSVGAYDKARIELTDALQYWRTRQPPEPLEMASTANNLAAVERATGSFSAAQRLFEQALEARQRNLPDDDERIAESLSNLASVLSAKGQYVQAIQRYHEALAICQRRGKTTVLSTTAQLNLAMAYKSHNRLDKAAEHCRESLKLHRDTFGDDSPGLIAHYNALASLHAGQGDFDQAARHAERASELCRLHKLDRGKEAANALYQLASVEQQRGDTAGAQRHFQAALEIQRERGEATSVARTLNQLAALAAARGENVAAEKLYRQALEQPGIDEAFPKVSFMTSCNLARILHATGRKAEALALVKQATHLVEGPRSATSGAEAERARFFADFAPEFDLLVEWSLEAGDVQEAFAQAERGRSRTFLDELQLAGIDLRDTLSGPAARPLLDRELALRTKLSALRAQAAAVQGKQAAKELQALSQQLNAAQQEYSVVWGQVREASPLYRELLAQNAQTDSLAAARQTLLSERSLMLFYYLGTETSHLLLIGDAQRPLRALPLTVTPAVAKILEIKPGPLTRDLAARLVARRLVTVQRKPNARDLTGTVTSPKGVLATDQEQALTDLLLPAEVREQVLAQPLDYLLVIPDGALHQLPFESLLLRSRPTRRYVVDDFPPIAYGPSASILVRFAQRATVLSEPGPANEQLSVLTVGNPDYARKENAPPPAGGNEPRSLVSLSRESLLSLSGDLPMLPGTAAECRRVSQAFGVKRTTMLQGEEATEAGVRQQLGGRRYIHLAAHGFVDAENENLFGAIALTPPAKGNRLEDDGFLALHEIHALSLRGCELAVLSACRTNVGPDRPLEAGSTLARAFLSAGVRRVVSSHWSVDDASTAELIGLFCEEIAKSHDAGQPPNYATALHYARQRVKSQADWSEPYYWAPFVLTGPVK